jgi:hypothetical protein
MPQVAAFRADPTIVCDAEHPRLAALGQKKDVDGRDEARL